MKLAWSVQRRTTAASCRFMSEGGQREVLLIVLTLPPQPSHSCPYQAGFFI